MDFQDSKTYQNLQDAVKGELLTSGKYGLYASKAREEGLIQISNIFQETAGNEREHAEIWVRILNNGEMTDTFENLQNACKGEHLEWTCSYKEFAETARQEGFENIAKLFDGVASIEKHHEYRYDRLIDNMSRNRVSCKPGDSVWICLNCGYLYFGKCAPEVCPVCRHPKGFYQINCENY